MLLKRGETSILETDFSELEEERQNWKINKDLKIEIWRSYQNYISFLTSMLLNDKYAEYKLDIEKEIKSLKQQQKHFEVEPLMSFASDCCKKHVKRKRKRVEYE